jgi:hypothetical protein
MLKGVYQGVHGVRRKSGMCGFVSITIWSLVVSNLEEINLTSRLRDQGLSRQKK